MQKENKDRIVRKARKWLFPFYTVSLGEGSHSIILALILLASYLDPLLFLLLLITYIISDLRMTAVLSEKEGRKEKREGGEEREKERGGVKRGRYSLGGCGKGGETTGGKAKGVESPNFETFTT